MSKIISTGYSDAYMKMQATSREIGENKDCTVKAISAATDVDYMTVHAVLQMCGRRNGRGATMSIQRAALNKLGYDIVEVSVLTMIRQYPGSHSNLKSVTTHHPERFNKVWADGNNYLLYTIGFRHVACVKNGINVDWTRGTAKRIERMYKVVKVGG